MSARRMVMAGATLLFLRAMAAAAGLDGWVSVISGTPPAGVSMEVAAAGAGVLVLLQLATVLVAPILLLAGGLMTAMHRGDRAAP